MRGKVILYSCGPSYEADNGGFNL